LPERHLPESYYRLLPKIAADPCDVRVDSVRLADDLRDTLQVLGIHIAAEPLQAIEDRLNEPPDAGG